MSERLLQNLLDPASAEPTALIAPDLANTIGSMDQTLCRELPGDRPDVEISGWRAGMEITPGVFLLRLIADGGMGSVWEARHERLGTEVAVKLVAPSLIEKHPSLISRLDQEAAALGRLDNPNIVRIFQHGTTANGTPFIIMELLEGVTLWDVAKRHGPLTLSEVAVVVEQVANGLSAVHREGIIHRDIKPQNIVLFARAGKVVVKLIDFGIAKEMEVNAVSNVTQAGTLLGTPHFMSPEQLLTPRDVDARTDLWSLAVVTYRALSNAYPFEGETIAGLFHEITTGKAIPIGSHGLDFPPEMDVWMSKALSRHAKHRFRTARELSQTLRRVAVAWESSPTRNSSSQEIADEETTARHDALNVAGSENASRPPSQGVRGQPGAERVPKKLLPYPFALMEGDGEIPSESSFIAARPSDVDEVLGPAESMRTPVIVAAIVAVVLILALLVWL